MTMQRRHYELIAETIRDTLQHNACGEDQRDMMDTVAHNFCNALASTNPNFNRARFLKACGVED